ncbi:hypothetical protein CMQ_3285 [Grosmannia clavigera kw1407]|uniref:Uncharacterized protein n=1 Tax=Grosmannia clavigera (strain kw1407 / UAMH 11150) TaxID=655863 RepID=F0XAS2_GROCL|nr:uncharacterized protein CMQ_3285 [Grosmannia clavigera kw1407]EFX05216.1 hypothetical protein CMQ_3285 [Grosmannia clavigera kw1407]
MSSTSKATSKTQWLSDRLSQPIKDLISKFYALADLKAPEAGPRMAVEVFSADALMITANGTFHSSSEISRSRDNAWAVVATRQHHVLQVFAGDQDVPDIALIGSLDTGFTNGKTLTAPFASLLKLDWPTGAEPRIRHLEVFALHLPLH